MWPLLLCCLWVLFGKGESGLGWALARFIGAHKPRNTMRFIIQGATAIIREITGPYGPLPANLPCMWPVLPVAFPPLISSDAERGWEGAVVTGLARARHQMKKLPT